MPWQGQMAWQGDPAFAQSLSAAEAPVPKRGGSGLAAAFLSFLNRTADLEHGVHSSHHCWMRCKQQGAVCRHGRFFVNTHETNRGSN